MYQKIQLWLAYIPKKQSKENIYSISYSNCTFGRASIFLRPNFANIFSHVIMHRSKRFLQELSIPILWLGKYKKNLNFVSINTFFGWDERALPLHEALLLLNLRQQLTDWPESADLRWKGGGGWSRGYYLWPEQKWRQLDEYFNFLQAFEILVSRRRKIDSRPIMG